ncbi:MAG: PD-(D/E)XK nuclease domain-containing protein [Holosporaceae bacterium]
MAAAFQVIGTSSIRRLAFPTQTSLTGELITDSLACFLTSHQSDDPLVHLGLQGALLSTTALPLAQALAFGPAAFMATLTPLVLRHGIAVTAHFASMALSCSCSRQQPWIKALLNLFAGLVPTPAVDAQGVSIALPFQGGEVLFAHNWQAFFDGQHLNVTPTGTLQNTTHHTFDNCFHAANQDQFVVVKTNPEMIGLAWGSQEKVDVRFFKRADSQTALDNPVTSLLVEADQLFEALLTTILPWHSAAATPIVKPVPVAHPNDRRELVDLLKDDPELFKLYLRSHLEKYIHTTSYDTTPALFGTLLHDFGLKTGGSVYQYTKANAQELALDHAQFLVLPRENSLDPILLAEFRNHHQRTDRAKSLALSAFKERIRQESLASFNQGRTPESLFLKTHDPHTFQEILKDKRHPPHRQRNLIKDEQCEHFSKRPSLLEESLDSLSHTRPWQDLEQAMRDRPDLRERKIQRLVLDAQLKETPPFQLKWHAHDASYNARTHKLRPSDRRAGHAFLTSHPDIAPHKTTLFETTAHTSFEQEGATLKGLLVDEHSMQRSAFDTFHSMIQDTQRRVIEPYLAAGVREDFYKGILTAKMLTHVKEGHFFPVVELQSGKGRVDLALIPRSESETAVLFELKRGSTSRLAMQQMHEKEYGVEMNRFPNIKHAWRVGMSFHPHDVQMEKDFYTVPQLDQHTDLSRFLANDDTEAFRYNFELFAKKNIKHHDLNARNTAFFPAFFSGFLAQGMAKKNLQAVWAHTENTYDNALIFVRPTYGNKLVVFHLEGRSGTTASTLPFDALQEIHAQNLDVAHFITSKITYGRAGPVQASDFTFNTFNDIASPPLSSKTRPVPFDTQGTTDSFAQFIKKLDQTKEREDFISYLNTLSAFSNQIFSQRGRQNESYQQGLILGSLADNTEHIEILNVNESGGTGRKRPDIVFKHDDTMTVIENKHGHGIQRPSHLANEALAQTRHNRYADGLHSFKKLVSVGIVAEPTHVGEHAFYIAHDTNAHTITDAAHHSVVRDLSLSYASTPERRADSEDLLTHLTSPPTKRRRVEDELPVGVSPLAVCKAKRARHKRNLCHPMTTDDKVKLSKRLHQHWAHKGLSSAHMVNTGLLMAKDFIHGNFEGPATMLVMHGLNKQIEKHVTAIAHSLAEGPLKQRLMRSAPVLGQSVGAALDVIDLAKSIRNFQHADNTYDKQTATLNIAVDTGYIALDVMEATALLTGYGATFGPVGLAASLVLSLTQQLVQAGLQLEQLEDQITLTEGEKFANFWRFFAGFDASSYLRDDIEAKAAYQHYLETLVTTYMHSGDYGFLIATLNDLQRTTKKTVRSATFWEDLSDLFSGQGPCRYNWQTLQTQPILPPLDVSVIDLHPDFSQRNRASSYSRILPAPRGTRWLCNPTANDIQSERSYLKEHTYACNHHKCFCKPGDHEIRVQRMHLDSSREAGKNFCHNSVMLQNVTSLSEHLFAYITHPLTAGFPENNPSTTILSPEALFRNFNLTLGNQDDTFVVSAPFDHFRSLLIDGGDGDDTLQFQYDFSPYHHSARFSHFENLIGSPHAQHIRAPQSIKYIDGGGGQDVITLLSGHTTSNPDPTSIALNGGETINPHHRETILIPSKDAQGTSTLLLEDTPQQHRILLDTLDDLRSIDWQQNTLSVTTQNSHVIALHNFQKEKHAVVFTCQDLWRDAFIANVTPVFSEKLSARNTHQKITNLHLFGESELLPLLNSDALEHMGQNTTLKTDKFNLSGTFHIQHGTQHALIKWDSHPLTSHAVAVTQPPSFAIDDLFLNYGPGHHHYLFQDWVQNIVINNQPAAPDGKYDVLSFPANSPYQLHKIEQKNNRLILHTHHKTQAQNGKITLDHMTAQTPLQIHYEGKTYGLSNCHPRTHSAHTVLCERTPFYFLSFNTHKITVVEKKDWQGYNGLYLPETNYVTLRSAGDAVLYEPHKNATIILKGLYSSLNNWGDPSSLVLHTPNGQTDTPWRETILQAPSIESWIHQKTEAFFDQKALYHVHHAPEQTTLALAGEKTPILHLDPSLFLYDLDVSDDRVTFLLRNQRGEKKALTVTNWNQLCADRRPLFVHQNKILDLTNCTSSDITHQMQLDTTARPHLVQDNSQTVLIPTSAIPHLFIQKESNQTSILRQHVHQHKDRVTKHSIHDTYHGPLRLLFYKHFYKAFDATTNKTETVYVENADKPSLVL